MSGMLSVVKENMPLMPSAISVSAVDGSSALVCFQASSKSRGVNSRTDGITAASASGTISRASSGIGRCP